MVDGQAVGRGCRGLVRPTEIKVNGKVVVLMQLLLTTRTRTFTVFVDQMIPFLVLPLCRIIIDTCNP
jgi:hypothetical protein